MSPSSPLPIDSDDVSDEKMCFYSGTIPGEILGHIASVCDPLEAATLISLWDASVQTNQWQQWRTVAAYVKDQLQGAVVARVQSGGLASVWPPRAVPSGRVDWNSLAQLIRPPAEDDFDEELAQWQAANESAGEHVTDAPLSVEDRLLQRMVVELDQTDTQLMQAIIPLHALEDALLLARAGFSKLAELHYMQCGEEAFCSAATPGTLSARPYTSQDFDLLSNLLTASFEHSLDCPALTGVQNPADILAGYQQTGQTGTDGWRIVSDGETPVGCLLLAGHNDQQLAELVYMGVLPAARGRGYGKQMVQLAQQLAREWQAEQLVLCVDVANLPARKIYESCGFEAFESRQAFVRRGR